jgi:hypothetical protein
MFHSFCDSKDWGHKFSCNSLKTPPLTELTSPEANAEIFELSLGIMHLQNDQVQARDWTFDDLSEIADICNQH